MNDIVSVLALPAVWSGGEPHKIITTLLDALLGMLGLSFFYARVRLESNGPAFEVLSVSKSYARNHASREICRAMNQWFGEDPQKWSPQVRSLFADEELSTFPIQLGLQGEIGLIVAASHRPAFPESTERLVLSVAANQASIGLQQAWLLSEQKRVARELDLQVTERSAGLAAANKELRKEIADRRKIEERLLESEELLLEAQRVSHTGSWKHDLASNEVSTSPEMARIFAIAPHEDPTRAEFFFSRIHSDDRPREASNYARALDEKQGFESDYQIVLPDGSIKYIHNTGRPKLNDVGEVVEFLGTALDVTEQHRARAALQQAFDEIKRSEAKLRQVINTIPTTAWSTRPDGYCEFLSERWLNYAGMTSEQAQGWAWADVIHPDDARPLYEHWTSCLASGTPIDTEVRMRRFDGTYRWFIFRASPLRDESGAVVRWYGTNIDIDDRKRAEEQIRRSEAFLAEAQQLTRIGSFSWRVAKNEITWSEQLYRIFEFEPGLDLTLDLIGSRVHPDDIPSMADMIEKAQHEGSDIEYEHRLLMPDRSIRYLHFIAHAIRDQEGWLEYIGAVQDVTQRHLDEEALARTRVELAHVARVSSLGVLTASIAHEVNQPLSGIVTNAGTCLRMLNADPPNIDGARETARRTIRDGNRASDVITRLRTLFGRKEITAEPVEVNEACRDVIALSLSEWQRNSVSLRFELADEALWVRGDRVQLQQVILNLLRNASDAMISVDDRPRELLVRTERDGEDRVTLTVKDVGIGFDPEHAEKLFEGFYTTKSDGMGIGLSVSRSIIEAHQGRLWAMPNDGPGATFAFSIPLEPDCAAGNNGAVRTSDGTDLAP